MTVSNLICQKVQRPTCNLYSRIITLVSVVVLEIYQSIEVNPNVKLQKKLAKQEREQREKKIKAWKIRSPSVGGTDSGVERWREWDYWFLFIGVSFHCVLLRACLIACMLKCYMLQEWSLLSVIKWPIGRTMSLQQSQAHCCVRRSTSPSVSRHCRPLYPPPLP